jgi:adenylate cyclase
MAIESERRFLVPAVEAEKLSAQIPHQRITQGYLSLNSECPVRIRVVTTDYGISALGWTQAYLTVKGKKDAQGSGLEFEYEVPVSEALEMLKLCSGRLIEKKRYFVWYRKTLTSGSTPSIQYLDVPLEGYNSNGIGFVEVDHFLGGLGGLVIAEVEDDPYFVAPAEWQDITSDHVYSNVALARTP